ncbi:TolB family protein [Dactylosporangium sp. CA-052675]|uniref:TolB family protein n=1 Tax=Dactylosporangium sp. CA-052675 TaxID=3239927 RepID=UPI003D8D79D5
MNAKTIKHTLALAGIAAVAAAFAGTTTAAASTTTTASNPTVYASHGAIYLKHAGHTTRLTTDTVSRQPTLSPDNTQIAYVHNDTIWLMHTDGTDQHQISDRTGTDPAWDPSGVRITYTATSCTGAPGTFRTGTDGATASEVLTPAACVTQDAPLVGYITG